MLRREFMKLWAAAAAVPAWFLKPKEAVPESRPKREIVWQVLFRISKEPCVFYQVTGVGTKVGMGIVGHEPVVFIKSTHPLVTRAGRRLRREDRVCTCHTFRVEGMGKRLVTKPSEVKIIQEAFVIFCQCGCIVAAGRSFNEAVSCPRCGHRAGSGRGGLECQDDDRVYPGVL